MAAIIDQFRNPIESYNPPVAAIEHFAHFLVHDTGTLIKGSWGHDTTCSALVSFSFAIISFFKSFQSINYLYIIYINYEKSIIVKNERCFFRLK
jgi:hypothetical protein